MLDPVFAAVRLVNAGLRRASFVGLTDSPDFSISLPRKLILSGGLFLKNSGGFGPSVIWQNLKDGALRMQSLEVNSDPVAAGKLARQTSLVQAQYIYKTEK